MTLPINEIVCGDCVVRMDELPENSVDLVFGSPPYEDARTYGIDFKLHGQEWVDWMVKVVMSSLRVSRGLVAFVVAGRTRKYRWSATPALLMADLHRAGVHLRDPCIFHRVGIPGSGGPDWLRHDYEFIVCATNGGKLPWSDNTAMGHPPKWGPGGEMSHRVTDGSRVNQWGHPINSGATVGDKDHVTCKGKRPSHTQTPFGQRPSEACGREGYKKTYFNGKGHPGRRRLERGHEKGSCATVPVLANPGNVVSCKVGGGLMGSDLAHNNEAPFPESLAEFFVRSFCPPGGIVLDPFSGSGTTIAVAIKTGRQYIGIDLRDSQVDLTQRRIEEAANARNLFWEAAI